MSTWHERHHREPETEFGHLLVMLRQARGWSQNQLANRAGLDHSYISRLETGQRQPARDVVGTFAEVFRIHATDRDVMYAKAGYWPEGVPVVPTELLRYRAAIGGIEKAEL